MTQIIYANNDTSNLAGGISSTSTFAQLTPGTGVLFPGGVGGLAAGQIFKLTFIDALTGLRNEIVNVTAIGTGNGLLADQVQIVRGQEGTAAQAWLAGDIAANLITAGFLNSLIQAVTFNSARIVTLSGVFTMSTADYAIGLNRTSSIATSSTTLPSGSNVGQQYSIEDLSDNFNAFPVTVNAPAGHNISDLASVVLNVNRQAATFRYYGSNTWSVNYGT